MVFGFSENKKAGNEEVVQSTLLKFKVAYQFLI